MHNFKKIEALPSQAFSFKLRDTDSKGRRAVQAVLFAVGKNAMHFKQTGLICAIDVHDM